MTYRYYYDTEFIEDGSTIDLISIGIVSEDGDAYYAVNSDAPWERVYKHSWLMENVWPHLPVTGYSTQLGYIGAGEHGTVMKSRGHLDTKSTQVRPEWVIANEVREFLTESGDDIELWADYGSYDHVALMQLWGPMVKKPKGIPMFTYDIQQAAAMAGLRDLLPEQEGTAHKLQVCQPCAAPRDVVSALGPLVERHAFLIPPWRARRWPRRCPACTGRTPLARPG